jgi:inorganic triphosphatase YgiF
MAHKVEIELKLELQKSDMRALADSATLRRSAARAKTEELVSTYFDTTKLKLRKHSVSLRIRRIGDRHTQTATLNRDEWECEVEEGTPDFDAARGTALEPLLTRKTRRSLKPIFETVVRRTVYPIMLDGTEIELSLDKGSVQDGHKSLAFCEVELELLRGDGAHLFRLARQLASLTPLQLGVKSKAERGYALITGEPSEPVKSLQAALTPEFDTKSAFKVIARSCLHQLIANVPAVLAGNAEGLHQARVALRRLRAAISLFSEMLNDPQTKRVKRALKWLTSEFGPARELDVFLAKTVSPLVRHDREKPLRRFKADVERFRGQGFDRAHVAVETARFRKLLLDAAAWIEVGDWTRNEHELLHTLRRRPIGKAAYEQLDRRWKKILKRGKRIESLDPRRLHKLRIAAKKLRYASEFFKDVFSGKRTFRRQKRFMGCLKALQDDLGDLNDIRVNIGVTRALVHRRSGRVSGGSLAFTSGRVSGREEARRAAAMKSAQAAFTRFRQTESFWD